MRILDSQPLHPFPFLRVCETTDAAAQFDAGQDAILKGMRHKLGRAATAFPFLACAVPPTPITLAPTPERPRPSLDYLCELSLCGLLAGVTTCMEEKGRDGAHSRVSLSSARGGWLHIRKMYGVLGLSLPPPRTNDLGVLQSIFITPPRDPTVQACQEVREV